MAEARRAILKVMWHQELGPKMEEARTLLDASIMREGAMLAQLSDTAADVTDETDRRHLARIRNLLHDVQTRHRRLIVVVQNTADEYLHLQADALKLRPLARLPDLENEILDPLLRGEYPAGLFEDLGVQAPTGILLKGPPGTGKTTVARILAHEAKCNFYAITPADINQMYVGESEKRVRDLFAKARANPPAIIFVDEIDALLPIRGGGVAIHSDKVVNQFLQEMDGLTANNRVFIVGATNRPDMLDPALRRGGRLSREIEIPIPDLEARRQLFALCTRHANLAPDVDLELMAKQTEGYSGADIRALVNEAGLQALIRIADRSDKKIDRTLTMADFTGALENLG